MMKGSRVHSFMAIKPLSKPTGLSTTRWLFKCDCGQAREKNAVFLYRPDCKSCGCSRLKDITGIRKGMLIAIERSETIKGQSFWKCKCDCGNTCYHPIGELNRKSGGYMSCGCLSIANRLGTRPLPERDLEALSQKIIKAQPNLSVYKIWEIKIDNRTFVRAKLQCDYCEHIWKVKNIKGYIKKEKTCPKCTATSYSPASIKWLNYLRDTFDINIQHAENGGEKKFVLKNIEGKRFLKVDGWHAESKTAFEFDGDSIHGNPKIYKPLQKCNMYNSKTAKELNKERIERIHVLNSMGINVVQIWQSDHKKGKYFNEVHKGNNKALPIPCKD